MAKGSGYDSDNLDAEGEALILHQFEVDSRGKPIISSIPSNNYDQENEIKEVQNGDDDSESGDLESGFFERPNRNSKSGKVVTSSTIPSNDPSREKDGRPDWLLKTLDKTSRFKHIRLFIGFGLLGLAGLAIYLSLGGKDEGKGHTFHIGQDIWNDGDGLLPYDFPTKIGFEGPLKTGSPPNLIQEETLKATPTRGSLPYETRLPQLQGFNPFEHMGPLSPYFSSPGFGIDDSQQLPLPSTCSVSQVQILHRHGSRYPTTGSPAELVAKFISNISPSTFSGPLSFLQHYQYRLGSELLTPIGRSQLYQSGVHSSILYEDLIRKDLDVNKGRKLFVRTGSQQRIVDSSISWLQGFFGMEYWQDQTDLEVQIESEGLNTTLAPNFACPNSNEGTGGGGKESDLWVEKFLKDAVERLQPYSKGKDLTPEILFGFMQTCSYDTVAFGHSDFCGLFNIEEWLNYEYAWDLKFYNSYGNGNQVGPAMGIGWVNEFLSRLKNQKWDQNLQTSENSTFNGNDRTFPVDRNFYIDFTHDSTIASVLAALQLPDFSRDLKSDYFDTERRYKTSNIVPFAARLTFELLSCSSSYSRDGTKWLRMSLNDAIVPLSQLSPCEARPDGLCSLENFLKSQENRMSKAHWERCHSK